tara:strand:- start:160 stop:495 length:336 start_codon:yes stop_codon:yes gene_type:complete
MASFVKPYKLIVTIENNKTLDIKIFHKLGDSYTLLFAKKRFLGPDGVVLDYITTVDRQYDINYVNNLPDNRTKQFNNFHDAEQEAQKIIQTESVAAFQGGGQSPFHGEWRF